MCFCLAFVLAQPARAENTQTEQTPPPITAEFPKTLKYTVPARVDKVLDGNTVLMKDGKIIRLLAIDYPFVPGQQDSLPVIAGKTMLERLLPEGTDVMLYQTRDQKIPRMNRMGQILAHLVNKKTGQWINGEMIRSGVAWTATDAANPDMAADLYGLEEKARAESKGLWDKNSPFGLLTPDTAAQGIGTFRLVEGTINRAATSKNNLYLNFGNDWRKDFTVMVTPALRRKMSQNGLDPMALSGTKVRVRGWLREWNGPFMELETVERMEILSSPPSPTPAAAP